MIPPELISTAIDIASIVSWLDSGGENGAAPTPTKMAKSSSTKENFDGAVNLKVYHFKLDDWAMDIIDTIDQELGKKILQPEGMYYLLHVCSGPQLCGPCTPWRTLTFEDCK